MWLGGLLLQALRADGKAGFPWEIAWLVPRISLFLYRGVLEACVSEACVFILIRCEDLTIWTMLVINDNASLIYHGKTRQVILGWE